MKTKLFKTTILLAVMVAAFFIFKPKEAKAGIGDWDFSSSTGRWEPYDGYHYHCVGSWWWNSCVATGGAVGHSGAGDIW